MQHLIKKLKLLKKNHLLVMIKGGNEVEAMNFEELNIMKKISHNIIPMIVKIGGPEARNDIEYLLSIGVDRILAPMIETEYALRNFVETMQIIKQNQSVYLAINIETITAYKNVQDIFKSNYFSSINPVTVGRSDLSGSMGKDIDDDDVIQVSIDIIKKAKEFRKITSAGGKLTPFNALNLQKKLTSDYINTRHMILNRNSINISEDVRNALLWEKDFYNYLSSIFSIRNKFYKERIVSIE